METAITAIGTANPAYKRSQSEVPDLLAKAFDLKPAERRLLKAVYKGTGIDSRYSVLSDYIKQAGEFEFFPNDPLSSFPSTASRMKIYKDHALPLALAAIANCLDEKPTFDKTKITHLITISCTGMYAPGLDIEIVQKLSLDCSSKRTAINFMGCYGVFNGLKVADAICRAQPEAKVLLVSVELCTIHFQKNMSPDNIIANAIFADGAAAALVEGNPEAEKYFSMNRFYCDLVPQTSQEMAWHIADSGFDITLSSYVPEVIKSGIAAFIGRLMNNVNKSFSDIDLFAIHPGGLKILQACEESLNLTEEQNRFSYQVLRNYGNMSSATILFVLKEIWNNIHKQDHDKTIFSCAFGPGLTLESMLLRTNYV
jgi:predicted naringenin-chalcone synthase